MLRYLDGPDMANKYDDSWGAYKILPGRHTLGIDVNWGDFCPPGIFGSACFHWCYSGVVLDAKAGRTYVYDIEKNKDQVYLVMLDETKKVVVRGLCEKYPGLVPDLSKDPVKTIHERIERESKSLELQE
jgi:hypothetical protein